MTLEKAIEILGYHRDAVGKVAGSEFTNAMGLGIEALKRVKYYERMWDTWHLEPLPGETRD